MIFGMVRREGIPMKLKQLEALRAVSATGSLQAAASQLNVTQPAISRSIIELENELGVSLLSRSARGTTLTPFGANILARAQVIGREVRRIQEDAEATRGAFNGRLVIAVTPSAATAAFAETITAFSDARPDVQLHILEYRPQQIDAGLRDGSIDVAIFTQYGSSGDSPHYDLEAIYELGTTLAVSERYSGPLEVDVAQLGRLAWLALDAAVEGSFISHLFALHQMPPPARILRCSSLAMYVELARRLDVVSIWTDAGLDVLGRRLSAGTMKQLSVHEGTPHATMFLAYPSADLMTKTARDFIVWFQSSVRKTGDVPRFSVGGG
jgi:DNA-binding transcriptional LysR family regulator